MTLLARSEVNQPAELIQPEAFLEAGDELATTAEYRLQLQRLRRLQGTPQKLEYVRPHIHALTNAGRLSIQLDHELDVPGNLVDMINSDKDKYVLMQVVPQGATPEKLPDQLPVYPLTQETMDSLRVDEEGEPVSLEAQNAELEAERTDVYKLIDYEALSASGSLLEFRLKFKDADAVSRVENAPDTLWLTLNLKEFTTSAGLYIPQGSQIRRNLPLQIPSETAESYETLGIVVSWIFLGLMGLNGIINTSFDELDYAYLLDAVDGLQLSSFMPAMDVQLPPTINQFLVQMRDTASAEPSQKFNNEGESVSIQEAIFGEVPPSPPLNDRLAALGYETLTPLHEIQTVGIILTVMVVGALLMCLSQCCHKRTGSMFAERLGNNVRSFIFWGGLINLVLIFYLPLCVPSFINVIGMQWEGDVSTAVVLNSIWTLILVSIWLACPLLIFVVILRYRKHIGQFQYGLEKGYFEDERILKQDASKYQWKKDWIEMQRTAHKKLSKKNSVKAQADVEPFTTASNLMDIMGADGTHVAQLVAQAGMDFAQVQSLVDELGVQKLEAIQELYAQFGAGSIGSLKQALKKGSDLQQLTNSFGIDLLIQYKYLQQELGLQFNSVKEIIRDVSPRNMQLLKDLSIAQGGLAELEEVNEFVKKVGQGKLLDLSDMSKVVGGAGNFSKLQRLIEEIGADKLVEIAIMKSQGISFEEIEDHEMEELLQNIPDGVRPEDFKRLRIVVDKVGGHKRFLNIKEFMNEMNVKSDRLATIKGFATAFSDDHFALIHRVLDKLGAERFKRFLNYTDEQVSEVLKVATMIQPQKNREVGQLTRDFTKLENYIEAQDYYSQMHDYYSEVVRTISARIGMDNFVQVQTFVASLSVERFNKFKELVAFDEGVSLAKMQTLALAMNAGKFNELKSNLQRRSVKQEFEYQESKNAGVTEEQLYLMHELVKQTNASQLNKLYMHVTGLEENLKLQLIKITRQLSPSPLADTLKHLSELPEATLSELRDIIKQVGPETFGGAQQLNLANKLGVKIDTELENMVQQIQNQIGRFEYFELQAILTQVEYTMWDDLIQVGKIVDPEQVDQIDTFISQLDAMQKKHFKVIAEEVGIEKLSLIEDVAYEMGHKEVQKVAQLLSEKVIGAKLSQACRIIEKFNSDQFQEMQSLLTKDMDAEQTVKLRKYVKEGYSLENMARLPDLEREVGSNRFIQLIQHAVIFGAEKLEAVHEIALQANKQEIDFLPQLESLAHAYTIEELQIVKKQLSVTQDLNQFDFNSLKKEAGVHDQFGKLQQLGQFAQIYSNQSHDMVDLIKKTFETGDLKRCQQFQKATDLAGAIGVKNMVDLAKSKNESKDIKGDMAKYKDQIEGMTGFLKSLFEGGQNETEPQVRQSEASEDLENSMRALYEGGEIEMMPVKKKTNKSHKKRKNLVKTSNYESLERQLPKKNAWVLFGMRLPAWLVPRNRNKDELGNQVHRAKEILPVDHGWQKGARSKEHMWAGPIDRDIGELYKKMNVNPKQNTVEAVLFFNMFNMWRKMTYAITLVFYANDFRAQAYTQITCSAIMLMYLIKYWPCARHGDNMSKVLNELTFICLLLNATYIKEMQNQILEYSPNEDPAATLQVVGVIMMVLIFLNILYHCYRLLENSILACFSIKRRRQQIASKWLGPPSVNDPRFHNDSSTDSSGISDNNDDWPVQQPKEPEAEEEELIRVPVECQPEIELGQPREETISPLPLPEEIEMLTEPEEDIEYELDIELPLRPKILEGDEIPKCENIIGKFEPPQATYGLQVIPTMPSDQQDLGFEMPLRPMQFPTLPTIGQDQVTSQNEDEIELGFKLKFPSSELFTQRVTPIPAPGMIDPLPSRPNPIMIDPTDFVKDVDFPRKVRDHRPELPRTVYHKDKMILGKPPKPIKPKPFQKVLNTIPMPMRIKNVPFKPPAVEKKGQPKQTPQSPVKHSPTLRNSVPDHEFGTEAVPVRFPEKNQIAIQQLTLADNQRFERVILGDVDYQTERLLNALKEEGKIQAFRLQGTEEDPEAEVILNGGLVSMAKYPSIKKKQDEKKFLSRVTNQLLHEQMVRMQYMTTQGQERLSSASPDNRSPIDRKANNFIGGGLHPQGTIHQSQDGMSQEFFEEPQTYQERNSPIHKSIKSTVDVTQPTDGMTSPKVGLNEMARASSLRKQAAQEEEELRQEVERRSALLSQQSMSRPMTNSHANRSPYIQHQPEQSIGSNNISQL